MEKGFIVLNSNIIRGCSMKVPMSKYLTNQKSALKKLVELLSKEFEYVSVLGTDVRGKTYSVYKTGASINDSPWAERGFVVRVHNGYNYSEIGRASCRERV